MHVAAVNRVDSMLAIQPDSREKAMKVNDHLGN
jgi:hypothetical protein